MKCNNCGGEMEFKKNEDILIPVGDEELKIFAKNKENEK